MNGFEQTLDSFFGYAKQSADIYNSVVNRPQTVPTTPPPPKTPEEKQNNTIKTVAIVAGVLIASVVVYKIATK